MRSAGKLFHHRGWSVGTSSNYSVVLRDDPLRILVTASGKDKGRLSTSDFVVVDRSGRAVEAGDPRPSAETLLHVAIAEQIPGVGSILHTHSVWGTLLSELHGPQGFLEIEGFEMLKGLSGVPSHERSVRIAIFENTQDMVELSNRLRERFDALDAGVQYAFLIRRHGLYTWGRSVDEARRHVEVLEFLFEVIGREYSLRR